MTQETKHSFVHVLGDDWEGLYVDGVLQLQGHSLPTSECILLAIAKPPKSYEIRTVCQEWFERRDSLPKSLRKVTIE